MALQTVTLDFTGKVSGSTVENKNVAYLNDVEFTQTQYNQIFGNELRVSETDKLSFEFPIDDEYLLLLSSNTIYYKSKLDSGENELRCNDKAVYNDDTTTYKQKLLNTYEVDLDEKVLKFNITSTGSYGIYEVKVEVVYDDNGLNSYGGQYQYSENGVVTTIPIQNKKLEEITTELQSRPVNSITNVTFAQIGVESIDV